METYKQQKLKEFKERFEDSKYYTIERDFLSETIDEILNCLPEEDCMQYNDSYPDGFNDCRKQFINNLTKK